VRRLTLAVLLGALALPLVSDAAAPLRQVSWADSRHAWGLRELGLRCKPAHDVCASEDGGQTWRGIFSGGTFIFHAVRATARAGYVSTGRTASFTFWTRDAGARWYQSRLLDSPVELVVGRGVLYEAGEHLYRIGPFPPRGALPCPPGVEDLSPPPCGIPPGEAGMSKEVVADPPAGWVLTGEARSVPGGVAAVAAPADASPYERLGLLVYRLGQASFSEVPVPGGTKASSASLHVSWPSLIVVAFAARELGWVSADGGATWSEPFGGDGAPSAGSASPDPDHRFLRCGGWLCATDDGGATSRRVLRGAVPLFLRASARAGIAVRAGGPLVTVDGGRSWSPEPALKGARVVAGDDVDLFWHRGGRSLLRLVPWPADRPRRARIVARVRGRLEAMASLRGGVVALVLPASSGRPRVLVFRDGRTRVTRLASASTGGPYRLVVAWPDIFVVAPSALWRSADGGTSWRLLTP
jgi:hypothetical protein